MKNGRRELIEASELIMPRDAETHDFNPYRTADLELCGEISRRWKWARRIAKIGASLGVCIPIANAALALVWLWSLPPVPPGAGRSGTPVFAALMLAAIGGPLLALLFAIIGGLVGTVLDFIWPTFVDTPETKSREGHV